MKSSLNWSAEMLTVVSELRSLQLLSYLTIFLLFQVTDAKRDLQSACLTCQQITENFNKVTEWFLNVLIVFFLIMHVCSNLPFQWIGFCFCSPLSLFCTFETLSFRALKEQQNRTLVEATQPGRRENSPNMRPGEMMQPGSGHIALGAGQQIFVSVQLET